MRRSTGPSYLRKPEPGVQLQSRTFDTALELLEQVFRERKSVRLTAREMSTQQKIFDLRRNGEKVD